MRNEKSKHRRRSGGNSIVEFGPTMWIVFIIFTFPLLTFGTLGLRYCFVNNAVCYAAESAGQADSFLANTTDSAGNNHLSAVNSARAMMTLAAATWHGITLTNPATVSIVITPLNGNPVTTQTVVLTPAQLQVQGANVYLIQVSQQVSISPLFPQNFIAGTIPGLNAPISTTVTYQKYFESPGLLGV